ncbi:unknown protein [Desulfotalea psychrophila LSv54]|uniref:Uncharacterized protein n=1 Tax=Desulfotalea psychrophila (strain LSv54 / DSM 12343) TaxID=177439 RepID=Q6AIR4_DESPS|nr:unknown protein [Desulfotalea psychrophila LSv54]
MKKLYPLLAKFVQKKHMFSFFLLLAKKNPISIGKTKPSLKKISGKSFFFRKRERQRPRNNGQKLHFRTKRQVVS